jgi:hypothetical protein
MGVELATRDEISLDIVARLMFRSTSDSTALIVHSVQYDTLKRSHFFISKRLETPPCFSDSQCSKYHVSLSSIPTSLT